MNIAPEITNAEALPNRERYTAHHTYHCVDTASAVVHGHADVPSVAAWAASLVHMACTTCAEREHALDGEVGTLGQAGGPT